MADRVGQQLGNYRITRLLGRGGFAEVYLGEHIYLKSQAALKVLRTSLSDEDVQRFLAEAQTLVRLKHPHIVRVLEFAVEQGTPVLVMDYASGGTLRQFYPRGSHLSLAMTITYVQYIAAALQYAHNHNVIHRDVKPENMLLSSDQQLLLSDFGLALFAPSPNLLSTQEMAGTMPYTAPEQLRGKPSFASDQYSLGIVAYEWLCGRRPFEGTQWELIYQHMSVAPPPLREFSSTVPGMVEDAVLRALAKDPQERFVSMQAFAQALERARPGNMLDIDEDSQITSPLKVVSPPSLVLAPRHPLHEMPLSKVFLSASPADAAFTTRLKADLQKRGVSFSNNPSSNSTEALDREDAMHQAIRGAGLVLVVVSLHTISSQIVNEQLRIAGIEQRRVIFLWAAGDNLAAMLLDAWEKTVPVDVIDARHSRYEVALDELVASLEEASLGAPFPPPSLSGSQQDLLSQQAAPLSAQKHTQAKHSVLPTRSSNHQRLLEKVRAFWIKGVLEQSLHGAALIALGLNEQQDAVMNPWSLVLKLSDNSAQALPAGTRITQVYDGASSELLILGEPGSGKTTLLLELARDLLDRAQLDDTHPIPVVLNLSSWVSKRQPITDWLVEELNTKYQVPRKLGKSWVNDDHILPLLDGLDEVASAYRSVCINAINVYRQEHGLVPMVLCSRSAEYLDQPTRLQLYRAVVLQPLTAQQIDAYLASAGEQLEVVRMALRTDVGLQEMASSPLMLSVLTLAYHGRPAKDLVTEGSPAARQRQVFTTYVQRMLERRGNDTHYTLQQTNHWLSWLAKQMVYRSQTVFYIERMQPDWLPNPRGSRLYRVMVRLVLGLIVGLLCGLIVGLLAGMSSGLLSVLLIWFFFELRSSFYSGLFGGLIGGLIGGLVLGEFVLYNIFEGLFCGMVAGLIFGLLSGVIPRAETEIQPSEIVVWSWSSAWRSAWRGMIFGPLLVAGIVQFILINGLIRFDQISILQLWPQGLPIEALVGSSVGGFIAGLIGGLSNEKLDEYHHVRPNQGIRQSARNSILLGIVYGLIFGLLCALVFGSSLVSGLFNAPFPGLGLLGGLLIGLVIGLLNGGVACISHVILRWLLWNATFIPWHYARFLDYAAGHILLRKVGGGYFFVHRQLLDYFASLNTSSSSNSNTERAQAQTIDIES